jgi:hypothetical protein
MAQTEGEYYQYFSDGWKAALERQGAQNILARTALERHQDKAGFRLA